MAGEDDKKKESSKEPKLVPRKQLPSVAYLLAHGDPEKAGQPKSWKETYGFPLVLALIFFVSLLTFHYAPHSKSTHKGFKLPQRNRPLMDPRAAAPEPEKPPADEL